MKQKLYLIITDKQNFYTNASDIAYAIDKANQFIFESTTTGVTPEVILEVKYIGSYINPKMS